MEENEIRNYFNKYSNLFTAKTFYEIIFRLANPKSIEESFTVGRSILATLSTSELSDFVNPTVISAELRERWPKEVEKNLKTIYKVLKKELNIKTYNDDHLPEKYSQNRAILEYFGEEIKTIFDPFGGKISFYKNPEAHQGFIGESVRVVSNDLYYEGHDYQMNAEELIKKFKAVGRTFDLVDIDPFGNPASHGSIEDMVSLANKCIIFTCCSCCRSENLPKIKQNWNYSKYGIAPRKKSESFIEKTIKYMEALGKHLNKDIQPLGYISWRGMQGFRIVFSIKPIREK